MSNSKNAEFIGKSKLNPSTAAGIKCAKVGATLGVRFGPQGVLIGGAVGFIAGAVIGGVLDDPLDCL